jgi:hypothetical protein
LGRVALAPRLHEVTQTWLEDLARAAASDLTSAMEIRTPS